MKIIRSIFLVYAGVSASLVAVSQNVLMNVLTQNSGVVRKGGTVFLEVSICNTDPTTAVPVYKLRPQISAPAAFLSIPDSGHVLPKGWVVSFNSGSVMRLSNGIDELPPNTCRTILIAMKGIKVSEPSTISGNLLFSNGMSPGSSPGPSSTSDNPADNTSTSTCKVIN